MRSLFATLRSNRKYANLSSSPRASMLIDNRGAGEANCHRAGAVTAEGDVVTLTEEEVARL